MKSRLSTVLFIIFPAILFLQACIHEYPYGTGENPTFIETQLDITFNLKWQRLLHLLEVETRDNRVDYLHKFTIEISRDGRVYSRDIEYLSDDEFSLGKMTYSKSLPVATEPYEVAVWYENLKPDNPGNFYIEDFTKLKVSENFTLAEQPPACGFANKTLNLNVNNPARGNNLVEELELQFPGARFELIATDVNQFISDQKASLNQGDTFSLNLMVHNNSSYSFNLYTGKVEFLNDNISLKDNLFFPFAEYEELTIAQGFLFCDSEDEITMKLAVFNSARILVTQTENFTFPVKRGFITTIRGDFLTHYLDGSLSIDHIWEGEIVCEINDD